MKQRDFGEELRQFLRKLDEGTLALEEDKRPLRVKPAPFNGILYNVHKRALPVGLDQPVVWNLTEKEANQWILRYTKTRLLDVRESDAKTVVYFEKVKQDGEKHSVFENKKDITKDTDAKIINWEA